MTIAVTTPTGHVGRHVTQMLVRAGVRPRVLVRDPDRLDDTVREHVDVATVDLLDEDSVVAATEGVRSLYWVDPSAGGDDPLADYARATSAVVAALGRNQVERVVFQSSVGAELRHGAGEIDGLAATEEALDATEASVVHLRCGFFFTNLELQLDQVRAGMLSVVLPLDQPLAWVDPRDIAEVATSRLLSESWSGRVVQAVHGPEDLDWSDAVRIVTEATGHPLAVQRISDDEMRQAMSGSGMPAGMVEAVLGMSTGMRDGFVPEQPRSALSTTPTTLGSWAYEVLRPQLAE